MNLGGLLGKELDGDISQRSGEDNSLGGRASWLRRLLGARGWWSGRLGFGSEKFLEEGHFGWWKKMVLCLIFVDGCGVTKEN